MTIFDLLFLVALLSSAITLVRLAYLFLRRRSARATQLLQRFGAAVITYFIILLTVSVVQPRQTVAEGIQQCFDDWCIVVNGATRQATIGSAAGDFVIVRAAVVSRARGRRQRETDVYGVLLDDKGRMYRQSNRGQAALQQATGGGASLTDFVAPSGSNAVSLVFEVSDDARSFEFVTRHGWFPGALIIGGAASLLHRPVVVPLSELPPTLR